MPDPVGRRDQVTDRRASPITSLSARVSARNARVGRVCMRPGCQTVLSMYNADPHCWAHQPVFIPRPGQVLRG
jgi:hypothetical protein